MRIGVLADGFAPCFGTVIGARDMQRLLVRASKSLGTNVNCLDQFRAVSREYWLAPARLFTNDPGSVRLNEYCNG